MKLLDVKSINKNFPSFFKEMMRDNKHIIKWILPGFVSLIIILSISYVVTSKDSDSEKMANIIQVPMPSDNHMGGKNTHTEPNLKNKKHFSETTLKNSTALGVKEGYAIADNIVKGVGLSEDELKALHARQNREIKLMSGDMDSIVISPAKDGDPGITIGELLALHEQQGHEIEEADDRDDEIVIPASEYGYPGLSRDELTVLHKQQESEFENHGNWDEIVIPASEDGYIGISREELTTVQEQQNYELWESIVALNEPVAPPPEEGGPNLTVLELKELHKRQSLN